MTDRAILLNPLESYLDKPPGSAAYQFAEVVHDPLPKGAHELVGTLNGVPIYLADPCLDFNGIYADGEQTFSIGNIRLWENQFSSAHGGFNFQSFTLSELGDFVEKKHEQMTDDNAARQNECLVISSAEPDVRPPATQNTFDLNRTI